MYVDGWVLAVPAANKGAFTRMAIMATEVFKQHGAIEVADCWGEDVPDGELTSFPMAVKAEPGEVVVFAWAKWPDKATRDKGFAAVMDDPRFKGEEMRTMFDGKRMILGGFVPVQPLNQA